jgi:hypothetical protein
MCFVPCAASDACSNLFPFFIASSTQVLRVLDSVLDATRSTVPPFHLLHQIWVSQICYLKLIGGFSESLLLVLPFCLSIFFIDAALLLIYSSKSFLLLNFLLSIESYMLYLDFYIRITYCWCIFIFFITKGQWKTHTRTFKKLIHLS